MIKYRIEELIKDVTVKEGKDLYIAYGMALGYMEASLKMQEISLKEYSNYLRRLNKEEFKDCILEVRI